ncbi:MAG: hypothetical protein WBR18_02945 [Anaerolineales bacterium]
MPRLTRWYAKASLIYFLLALVIALALALPSSFNLPGWIGALSPVYFHLFMVGWISQLIFGVMVWMFPKYSQEQPRGRQGLLWAVFGSLNVGLILRSVAEPMMAVSPAALWGWLLATSAALQVLAGIGLVVSVWPRVKER